MNVALLMLTNNGFSHVHLLLPARNCAICNKSYNSPQFVVDMKVTKLLLPLKFQISLVSSFLTYYIINS